MSEPPNTITDEITHDDDDNNKNDDKTNNSFTEKSLFQGKIGGDSAVVATFDGSLLTKKNRPIISQNDENETVLISFKNYSGLLKVSKGSDGEFRLSFDSQNVVSKSEWWPASPPPTPLAPLLFETKGVENEAAKEEQDQDQEEENSSNANAESSIPPTSTPSQTLTRSVSWKGPAPAKRPSIIKTTHRYQQQKEQPPPPPPLSPPPPPSTPWSPLDDDDEEEGDDTFQPLISNQPGARTSALARNGHEIEPSLEMTVLSSSSTDSGMRLMNHGGTKGPYGEIELGNSSHKKKHWADYSFRPQDARTATESMEFKLPRGISMRSNNGDWDPDESDYVSPLHEACDSPFATKGELEDALADSPTAVSKQDDKGRLPLHILANNRELIVAGGEAGREMATSFAKQLIKAYPEAVMVEDQEGRLPFTGQIIRWIEWTYNRDDKGGDKGTSMVQTNLSGPSFTSRLVSKFTVGSRSGSASADVGIPSIKGLSMISESGLPDVNRGTTQIMDQGSTKRFPPAEITEEVGWCFDMLSLALDLSGGRTTSGISRPQLSYKNQLDNRGKIARNVAKIPLLLKTIFLLESNDERARILQSSIIRRVLLSPESIDSWLTYMLRCRPIPSRLAVDYFEVISNLSVQDFIGIFRKPSPGDMKEFRVARKAMFDEIFELGGTIPSLVVLDEKEIERAASTRAVYFVMSKSLTQPLVVALVMTDLVMQITLMLAFRSEVLTPEIGQLTEKMPIPSNHVIITICSYLLFREIVDVVALGGVSKKVVFRHLMDPWNIVDVSCICFTLSSAIFVHIEGVNMARGLLHAVTLGLLWVRLLTFLKVVNERTALFILALVQILRDARYFLIVFTAAIFLFSDMLIVIFNSDRENLCVGDNIPPSSLDYCSTAPFNAYLRTYAIILGDIAVEDYRGTPAVTVIFCMITFFAFIILLNVLIAVLSASYDQARRQSASLFRRARIEFVASHTALESFVRPQKKRSRSIKSTGQRAVGAVILLSMLGTTIVAETFLVGASLAVKDHEDGLIFVIAYAFLSVVLSLGVWGVAFFTFGAFIGDFLPTYAAKGVRIADHMLQSVSRFAAVKLFGLTDPLGIDALFDSEDELNHIGDADEIAQLRWIRKELRTTERHLKDHVKTSEDRVRRQVLLAVDPSNTAIPLPSPTSTARKRPAGKSQLW